MIRVRNIDVLGLTSQEVKEEEEKKEVKRNEEEIEKPVLPTTTKSTELSHGGDESTNSIEGSPNPGGEEKQNRSGQRNTTESERESEAQNASGHKVHNADAKNKGENGEAEGEEESAGERGNYDEYQSHERNADEVVKVDKKTRSKNVALRTSLWRFIELIGDSRVGYSNDMSETVVMKYAVKRVINHYPLRYAYGRAIKENVAIILDTSGSMEWVSKVVNDIFNVLRNSENVLFFVAPNGKIKRMYDRKRGWVYVDHDVAMKMISNMVVVYLGDYDGANTVIELSWKTKVYWFCTESRYRYFESHDWVNYSEEDYRGVFARVYDEQELIRAINDILQHFYEQVLFLDYHEDDTFEDD